MTLERTVAKKRTLEINKWAMAGVLAAMWLTLSLLPATRNVFLTQGNLSTLFGQTAVLLVVSVGMTLVILIRGIDLSVGAGVALTGVITALLHRDAGLPVPVAIAATLVAGAIIGAWHGYWVGWLGVPAFIVTLAGFKAYRGGALVLSGSSGISLQQHFTCLNDRFSVVTTWGLVLGTLAACISLAMRDSMRRKLFGLELASAGSIARKLGAQVALAAALLGIFGGRGMPVLVAIACGVALLGIFITTRTTLGRHIYAIGGNPDAARLSGVNVKRVTLYVYMIVGALTALAGVLQVARLDGVTASNQGNLLELDAVTAVVIGGTSIAGGRGSIAGTVLGTFVFGTLANGMNLLHLNSNWQLIIGGVILLAAVLTDSLVKGRRS